MSMMNARMRAELDRRAAELIGDEVVLKFHDGNPGPDLTEHIVDTRGHVTPETFADGGNVQFLVDHTAEYRVSVWRDDTALFLLELPYHPVLDPYAATLADGDTLTIGSFPHCRSA